MKKNLKKKVKIYQPKRLLKIVACQISSHIVTTKGRKLSEDHEHACLTTRTFLLTTVEILKLNIPRVLHEYLARNLMNKYHQYFDNYNRNYESMIIEENFYKQIYSREIRIQLIKQLELPYNEIIKRWKFIKNLKIFFFY